MESWWFRKMFHHNLKSRPIIVVTWYRNIVFSKIWRHPIALQLSWLRVRGAEMGELWWELPYIGLHDLCLARNWSTGVTHCSATWNFLNRLLKFFGYFDKLCNLVLYLGIAKLVFLKILKKQIWHHFRRFMYIFLAIYQHIIGYCGRLQLIQIRGEISRS